LQNVDELCFFFVFKVCLIAVDESVLALTGYSIPDPLPIFYPNRSSGVISSFLRSFVLLLRFVFIISLVVEISFLK
jgi:Ni,Fe-hydrogenase I cytochrome b subunit